MALPYPTALAVGTLPHARLWWIAAVVALAAVYDGAWARAGVTGIAGEATSRTPGGRLPAASALPARRLAGPGLTLLSAVLRHCRAPDCATQYVQRGQRARL